MTDQQARPPALPEGDYAIVRQVAPETLQLSYCLDGKHFFILLNLKDAEQHARNVLSLVKQIKHERFRGRNGNGNGSKS